MELWELFSGSFRQGNPEIASSKVNFVNNPPHTDAMFIVWFRRLVHLHMSPHRDLKMYPKRNTYIMNKLFSDQKDHLARLVLGRVFLRLLKR